jgi:hypothetical protein
VIIKRELIFESSKMTTTSNNSNNNKSNTLFILSITPPTIFVLVQTLLLSYDSKYAFVEGKYGYGITMSCIVIISIVTVWFATWQLILVDVPLIREIFALDEKGNGSTTQKMTSNNNNNIKKKKPT